MIVTNGYCGGGCAERRAEAVEQGQQLAQHQQAQQQQMAQHQVDQQQTQQMARPRQQQAPPVAVGPGGAQLRVVR
ncbi:hypothetical protein [Nonomuraea rosea]|uniref:hypothetical protein n=1 Tax=Nonomuraea rosea TaxID=638574 RepID=UPI0031EFF5E9